MRCVPVGRNRVRTHYRAGAEERSSDKLSGRGAEAARSKQPERRMGMSTESVTDDGSGPGELPGSGGIESGDAPISLHSNTTVTNPTANTERRWRAKIRDFLRRVAPYIPGTDQWHTVLTRLYRASVSRQLRRLDRLRKLHPATKAKVRRSVFRHSSVLAKTALPVEMFKHGSGTWAALLLVIGLLANGPITASLLSFDYGVRAQ
jgi:hypothetical protein